MPEKLSQKEMESLTQFALSSSLAAGKISKSYFERRIKIQKKADRSPVTRADREAEQLIRKLIRKKYPHHSIVGEEFGEETQKGSEFRWYIDPIDGTLQFIRGLPFWGSVLGLEYQGRMIVGSIHHPALSLSIWAAKNRGCFVNGKRTRVSSITKLGNATLTYSGIRRMSPKHKSSLFKVVDQAYDDRGFGDCFGHSLVIRGIVDAMIDMKVSAHDISGVKVCVEEAGGHFSSLKGKKDIFGGTALSCTKALAPAILKHF